ncbi:MAG: GNAT family N-acetyltransferase [Tepidiformaceae bacterium]
MPVIQCVCGERLEGADDALLFNVIRAHADATHADLAIPDAAIARLIEAGGGLDGWDGRIRQLPAAPEIRPLQPSTLDDYLQFFDKVAFADNPAWSSCYCLFPHYTGDDWNTRTAAENRTDRIALIERGEAHGHIAYVAGEPAGWCSAAPHQTLAWVTTAPEFACADAEEVGSIVCFVVAPAYRRQGVATRLLDAACDEFRARGLRIAEAYPTRGARSDASAYHGPLEMYLEAGFERIRDVEGHTLVRKVL